VSPVLQRMPPPVNVTAVPAEYAPVMDVHELANTLACSVTVAFVHNIDGVAIGYPHVDPTV
jgi:hypothetical protein